ncbi:uncharacterized protein METZ01_LOCUS429212 [marine metagenome]|uniref:Uncharacterized protein n=1 Tax=marine metagenome TaxID=408172 RepID=A0A382Y1H9_9ZZZZ
MAHEQKNVASHVHPIQKQTTVTMRRAKIVPFKKNITNSLFKKDLFEKKWKKCKYQKIKMIHIKALKTRNAQI